MSTRRLTVAQALVEFLGHQWTVDGDLRERTVPEHPRDLRTRQRGGSRAGAQAVNVKDPTLLPYHQARNEQAMVHQAVGFARIHRRRATLAATASVGPGAANMLTGAAHGDGQPDAGAAAAERHLRHARRRPGPPAARAALRHRDPGHRRLPSVVALLRSGAATRAAVFDRAGGDASAHRPRRDGRRDDRSARGCSG